MKRSSPPPRRPTRDRAAPAGKVSVVRVGPKGTRASRGFDRVAGEEPLELRLIAGGERHTVAVTMRTPGDDFALAAGFLFAEGIVRGAGDIARIGYCTDAGEAQRYNVVEVTLAPGRDAAAAGLERLERHFTVTSACGVCGRTQLDDLEARGLEPFAPDAGPRVDGALLASLPERLRAAQPLFDRTGGLHAAGIFGPTGEVRAVREDVGRHNALDKAVGALLLSGALPRGDAMICLSGRASYELLQKAVAARVPVVAAVSAPSSLAVATARRFGVTLAGFVRDDRFTLYSGEARVG